MFEEDDIEIDEKKSNEIKQKVLGQPYLWKDLWYCLFNNESTFPHSTSVLCRIKIKDMDVGLIYVTNIDRRTYKERYFDDIKKLNGCYRISKRKILMRPGLNIGWEGKILNEPQYS